MKTLLIAVSALALSSGAVLARDVNSVAPDTDNLSNITQPVDAVANYTFQPASAHNVNSGHVIIQNDPATQPD